MIPNNAYNNNSNTDNDSSTPINELINEEDVEDENSDEIKKLNPIEARELYNEMNLIKSQLNLT